MEKRAASTPVPATVTPEGARLLEDLTRALTENQTTRQLRELQALQALQQMPGKAMGNAKQPTPMPVISAPVVSAPAPMLPAVSPATAVPMVSPTATPPMISAPVADLPTVAPAQTELIAPPKKKRRLKLFALRAGSLIVLLAVLGASAWGIFGSRSQQHGDVAGVSTAAPTATLPPVDSYNESYAVVPFDKTVWDSDNDIEFGIHIDWPKNASNRIRTSGSMNIWFLRFNGYLNKDTWLTQDSGVTLDDWWKRYGKDYTQDGAIVTNVTFKGRPAYMVTDPGTALTAGIAYFTKRDNGIFEVWTAKNGSQDDLLRVAHMLDSLTFDH